MRRFELIEGTSSKFWEIDLDGSGVTVRFGRLGTNGQTQTKTFADAAAAKKEHDKLVKEKTGKGYAEVATATGASLPAAPAPAVRPAPAPTSSAAPSPKPPAAAPAVTAPSASATPDAPAIEWPQGGFEWDASLLEKLPVVRGVHTPPPVDGHALLRNPIVFEDDTYGFATRSLTELAQALGRAWKPWDKATSASMITRERLAQADFDDWLELLAQSAYARTPRDPATFAIVFGQAQAWSTHVGIALHGLPFMIELGLTLLRALTAAGTQYLHYGHHDALMGGLRAAIASAPEEAHAAALATLEAQAGGTPLDRLLRAHLCPHREDWVLQSLADAHPDPHHLLACCVMPAAAALAYAKATAMQLYYLKQPVLLQIRLHDEGAIDLLAYVLDHVQDKSSLEDWLAIAERMRSPRMLPLLAGGLEHKEARATLDKLARRWPAAVLKCAIEQALASRSRLAEGWAVRMALREPAALAAVLPALDEGARTRFSALLASLQREDAADAELPPVLRQPPWLGKARATELPTLELTPRPTPERIDWTANEKERLAAKQPNNWLQQRMTNPAQYLQEDMQLTPEGATRVLGGQPLLAEDFKVVKRYFYGATVESVNALPDAAALALWNSYPSKYWYTWGDNATSIAVILARHGEAALPGLAAYVESHADDGLAIALPVDSARIVPTALHALRNLKKAKQPAMAWLRAHATTALTVALPAAFGRAGPGRDDARHGVRWLAGNGHEDEARRIAADYGGGLPEALQALLDADPLLVLPSRMPKLPGFFVAASFRRPELRGSGAALPVAAMEHIGTMLAISRLEAPYAGLALVREACTPESLAEFAWDLFEAWTAAGNPSKDNWAYTALGLLGNDETARRLAPKIREWPGEGGHQRAVTGLDLLATIGSDVALMHLNGIASKVKFKALQDRAKEKIAAVAEMRGFSAAELADRLVPDLGLDEHGSLELDFGPRRFHVAFDETLKPYVKDAQGARLKDLPKPIKSDDAALAEAATERYKQIKKDAKAVASLQVTRLELAMIDRRRWSAPDFRLFFLEHPLMRHLAARLMWGLYGADGAITGAFRVAEDWTLADGDDHTFVLPDDATIGIAHVLEVPKALQDAFGQVFADYEILQPFKQLGREVYALTEAEKKGSKVTRYASKVVATGSVMGLVNRGWERGQAQDGGWVGWFSKSVGENLQVDLELDPGTTVGDISYEPQQTLPAITLRTTGTWDQHGLVAFERLHPIVASEVLRDVEFLAPFKGP